ncbi:MAG TPA: hypothetical protein VL961_12360 [Acidimicrobiales bacterium]|nr:hypothetical protein [Acidimicrobiales bacterium]
MARARRGRKAASGRPLSNFGHWRRDGQPKASFTTRDDALRAAHFQLLEHGARLDVYVCDLCRSWHMGTPQGGAP